MVTPRLFLGRGVTAPAAAALAAGIASLLVSDRLGYDAWSWMVWARELMHGSLDLTGGPSFKALPVIFAAPFTPLGDAAVLVWLALVRMSALVALLLAYRVGARVAGRVAGIVAALLLAVGPDLFRTALYGSSEPIAVALVLGAADRLLAGRRRTALALLALVGLVRPEAWPIVIGLAVALLAVERRWEPAAPAMAIAPPAAWLGLVWLATGNPLLQFWPVIPSTVCGGCAALLVPAADTAAGVDVLARSTGAIALPALGLAAYGLLTAVRERRRELVLITATASAWFAIVFVSAMFGYPGSRRYLLEPVAVVAVLAGVGFAGALGAVRHAAARIAIVTVAVLVLAATAFPTVRENARLIGVARATDLDLDQLDRAIAVLGGPGRVLADGRPTINPWAQSALAWRLGVPLSSVQGSWGSTARHPHWARPSLVFRGSTFFGPVPAVPAARSVVPALRSGSWQLVRAP
jgi:hypothetical protein